MLFIANRIGRLIERVVIDVIGRLREQLKCEPRHRVKHDPGGEGEPANTGSNQMSVHGVQAVRGVTQRLIELGLGPAGRSHDHDWDGTFVW